MEEEEKEGHTQTAAQKTLEMKDKEWEWHPETRAYQLPNDFNTSLSILAFFP